MIFNTKYRNKLRPTTSKYCTKLHLMFSRYTLYTYSCVQTVKYMSEIKWTYHIISRNYFLIKKNKKHFPLILCRTTFYYVNSSRYFWMWQFVHPEYEILPISWKRDNKMEGVHKLQFSNFSTNCHLNFGLNFGWPNCYFLWSTIYL